MSYPMSEKGTGMANKGIIYVATGADYVDLARRSAASLRASNPGLQIDLFTDDTIAADLAMFDQVHPVPHNHSRAKLEAMPQARFDKCLFLDCDTLVLGDLGDVWGLLDRFDLAMAHDVRRASDLVQEGLDVTTPYAFPQLNSGVLLYRNTSQTRAFFADWAQKFHDSGVGRDQIILKDMLWETDLKFYVLPPEFNLRRVTELDAWEPLDARVKIIHSHRLLQHMRHPGAEQVLDLETLLHLERKALAREWEDEGHPHPDAQTKIGWFTRTE